MMASERGTRARAAEGEAPAASERGAGLWPGDAGTLDFDARRALLALVQGPFITAQRNGELWKALLNNQAAIRSRLADLFLDLVVDGASGIAFVRNVAAEGVEPPRAVKAQPLNTYDTALVLYLRHELLNSGSERAIVGRDEFLEQLGVLRPIGKLDDAAFAKKLDSAWNKLVKEGILQRTDVEGRWEISPVLVLVFGAEEVRAVQEEFDELLEAAAVGGVAGEASGAEAAPEADAADEEDV